MIYYVALPFTRVEEDGLAPGEAVECPNAASAVRRADALSRRAPNVGSVAFSRQGSPDLGEFEDAVVLRTFGEVPEDIGLPESSVAAGSFFERDDRDWQDC